jgi:hypothetical protein
LLLLLATLLVGCGGSQAERTGTTRGSRGVPSSPPATHGGPAFGLTEDNAELLWPPGSPAASGGALFDAARERLTALHPRYVRLLIDWAALQPERDRPPALAARNDGCARTVAPCAGYLGVGAELAAIAAQQQAARGEGRPGPEVVLDLFGVPNWAASDPSGCEPPGTRPFSRPISQGGLLGYRSLIDSLLALGRREGVALPWWSPWNEPNDPVFVSPQRSSCALDSAPRAPVVYTQLTEAMASELAASGGGHRILLGELNAYPSDSARRTSVSSFVAALPARVLCLAGAWAIHVYARWGGDAGESDPVGALEHDLDARGSCARGAPVWVTEAGAGAAHPGRRRPAGASAERRGCLALAEQLVRWSRDARVGAIFQYSFREDPAFPVGLLSADLQHLYSAYGVWYRYATGALAPARLAAAAPVVPAAASVAPAAACA